MPLKDPKARAAYNKQWRLNNIEHSRAYHRVYQKTWRDTDERRKYEREWKAARPEEGVKSKERMRKQRSTEEGRERQRAASWRSAGIPQPTYPRPFYCECCGRPPSPKRALCNDHDHDTNEFRGWLCFRCNTVAGRTRADIERLKSVLRYLERFYSGVSTHAECICTSDPKGGHEPHCPRRTR